MQYSEKEALSQVRIDHAQECLKAAEQLLDVGIYKSAANRSYYAVFHAMRAVLALNGIDKRKHSGIISEFRRLYIKTGIFDEEMSQIISELFDIRSDSDYDDFFVISKEEVIEQVANAKRFLDVICEYLSQKNP